MQRLLFPDDSPQSPNLLQANRLENLPVLTVCQPWAWAIIAGHKPCENRSWRINHRGRVWIHAGVSRKWLAEGATFLDHEGIVAPDLTFGAILGSVEIYDCVSTERAAAHCGRWAFGPWCGLLRDPIALAEPIPLRGALGLFRLPAELRGEQSPDMQTASRYER